jgi:TonB family protein
MVSPALLEAPSALSHEVAFMATSIDLLFKSLIIVLITNLIARRFVNNLGNTGVYALWLTAFACMLMLPMFSSNVAYTVGFVSPAEPFSLITIPLLRNISTDTGTLLFTAIWLRAFIFVYFSVLLFLVARLYLSIKRVNDIAVAADYQLSRYMQKLINRLCTELSIDKPIQFGISELVETPFSAGFKDYAIILPKNALDWDRKTLENVIVHELSHIQRGDFIALLLCELGTYVFWFNPFAWVINTKIKNSAEYNCDDCVLSRGTSSCRYAQDLVEVARNVMQIRRKRLFAQFMIDASEIETRVVNILQQPPVRKWSSLPVVTTCVVLSVIILASSANAKLISTTYHDFVQSSRMLYMEKPVYPVEAYKQEIQGWVLLKFDIDENGVVPRENIAIEFSQPDGVFEEVSIRTLENFRYEPKRVNGERVITENERFMFRFRLPKTED